MLKSMTGFGQETDLINNKKISVEVRTLNSRSLDANLRLTTGYRHLENDLRLLLNQVIGRGKVDLYLTVENESDFSSYKINSSLAAYYLKEIQKLAMEANLPVTADLLPSILRLPDVVSQVNTKVSGEETEAIIELAEKAMLEADQSRILEGEVIEKDLIQRMQTILKLLKDIVPHESKRIEDIRQRLRADLAQIEHRVQIDNNRFEQEIIYYLERIDFTEEKVRLEKHCLDFLRTMTDETAQGRKMGFISQEIGREINTLGSKAYNADLQKIVVAMKDELEKIKEQLLNIL